MSNAGPGSAPQPAPESEHLAGQHAAHGIRPSGGYRTLHSFQRATIIYDATVAFCERFVDARSRTVDQMVQAARSGRQNIAEGSRASAASSQTELRLVSVARASLDELLLDYEDFLRQRRLPLWAKDDPRAIAVRSVCRTAGSERGSHGQQTAQAWHESPGSHASHEPHGPTTADYAEWLRHRDPAVVANALICLIHQANYLLDQQLRALERDFIAGGGYSEKLAAARIAHRQHEQAARREAPAPTSGAPTAPNCPRCGKPMALRTARSGPHAGGQFWGCSAYPDCRGTLPLA